MIIVLSIIILTILILAHEMGHFFAAKACGIKVNEFAIGFPPRLFRFKKGDTLYSFNLIPFGGFVKIHGEDDGDAGKNENMDSTKFSSKKPGIKALVIAAGVIFNLFLAWILISWNFMVGMPSSVSAVEDRSLIKESKVVILDVQKDTPAEKAGLLPGDVIAYFASPAEVQNFISNNKGREIKLKINRNGDDLFFAVVPLINTEEGRGSLGVIMDEIGVLKLPWHESIWAGLKRTAELTFFIFKMIVNFIIDAFNGGKVLDNIAGPVGIVSMTGNVVKFGFSYILGFIAMFSINLAVLNILPFPALDGGRLLFVLIEKIKGSPVNYKISNATHAIGLIILFAFLIFITYRDIIKVM